MQNVLRQSPIAKIDDESAPKMWIRSFELKIHELQSY